MKHICHCDTPLGKVSIAQTDCAISHIFFGDADDLSGYEYRETTLLKEAHIELHEYFTGLRTQFDVPLAPRGTAFQESVWAALCTIPYGETRSYKDIAIQIDNPDAMRAVGMANNRNPIPIIIPCHRVIGANGSLVGYGGGLHIKEFLLELERG